MVQFSRNEADSIIISALHTPILVNMRLDVGDTKSAVGEFLNAVNRYNTVMNDDALVGWREIKWRRLLNAYTALAHAKQALLDTQLIPEIQKKKIEAELIIIPPAESEELRNKLFDQLAAIITVESSTRALNNIFGLWEDFEETAEIFLATYPSASKHIYKALDEYLKKGQSLKNILTDPDLVEIRTDLKKPLMNAITNLNALGHVLNTMFQGLPLDSKKKTTFVRIYVQVQSATKNELDRLAA